MSNLAVFAVGLLVTLLVAAAMALLIAGAIIDGREDDERRADNEQAGSGVAHPAAVDGPVVRLRVAGRK